MAEKNPYDPFAAQGMTAEKRPWLALVIAVLSLFVCFHFWMTIGSSSELTAQQGSDEPRYLRVAGRWFDASGQALTPPDDIGGSITSLWPIDSNTVIASIDEGPLWACDPAFRVCQRWGSDRLRPEEEFQLKAIGDGRLAMLSRDPSWLYLLDANGEILDSKLAAKTPSSMAWYQGRLYVSQQQQDRIRSIAMLDDQWQDWQTEVNFRQQPATEKAYSPRRLRRVGDQWWLILRPNEGASGLYALNQQWQIQARLVDHPSALRDWAPLEDGQMLFLDSEHRLWQGASTSGPFAAIQAPQLTAERQAEARLRQLFAFGMLLSFFALVAVFVYSHKQRYQPSRILNDLKRFTPDPAGGAEATAPADEPVWLEPTPDELKNIKRDQRTERWLNPLSRAVGIVLLCLAIWYQAWFVVLFISVFTLTELLDNRIFKPRQRALLQAHLGVQGGQLLLALPGKPPQPLRRRELFFDGYHLYCQPGALPLFSNQHFITGGVATPRFEPGTFTQSLVPLLETLPTRPPLRERLRVSVHDGSYRQQAPWILVALVVIGYALAGAL